MNYCDTFTIYQEFKYERFDFFDFALKFML